MKKICLSIALIALVLCSERTNAGTYTVYGKNNGTKVITVHSPDGGSTTTTTIDCDNWYNYVCYTWTDTPPPAPNPANPHRYIRLLSNDPDGAIMAEGYLEHYSKTDIDSHNSVSTLVLTSK